MEFELQSRCASSISKLRLANVPVFCASCAERFYAGYVTWCRDEKTPIPIASHLRQAIDLCWAGDTEGAQQLADRLRKESPSNGQPIFSSKLSLYIVEISLVDQALASLLQPAINCALLCSEYALDFHLQLADLRREEAGIGPDYKDPGRDMREILADPGALAEAERQIADASALRSSAVDIPALRAMSVEDGQRVLDELLRLVSPRP